MMSALVSEHRQTFVVDKIAAILFYTVAFNVPVRG